MFRTGQSSQELYANPSLGQITLIRGNVAVPLVTGRPAVAQQAIGRIGRVMSGNTSSTQLLSDDTGRTLTIRSSPRPGNVFVREKLLGLYRETKWTVE